MEARARGSAVAKGLPGLQGQRGLAFGARSNASFLDRFHWIGCNHHLICTSAANMRRQRSICPSCDDQVASTMLYYTKQDHLRDWALLWRIAALQRVNRPRNCLFYQCGMVGLSALLTPSRKKSQSLEESKLDAYDTSSDTTSKPPAPATPSFPPLPHKTPNPSPLPQSSISTPLLPLPAHLSTSRSLPLPNPLPSPLPSHLPSPPPSPMPSPPSSTNPPLLLPPNSNCPPPSSPIVPRPLPSSRPTSPTSASPSSPTAPALPSSRPSPPSATPWMMTVACASTTSWLPYSNP